MKKISSLLILVFFSVNLFSDIELSFGLNSKSIWRGLDQNDGNPTIYSEIEYEKNGFISNAWIESCCSNGSTNANKEVGLSVGYKHNFKDDLFLSISYIGTNYPNSKEENYDEIKLEFEIEEFNLKIFNGLEEMSNYYEISYEHLIKDTLLTISAGDFKPYGDMSESNGKNAQFNVQFKRLDLDFELFYFYFHPNGNSVLKDDGLVIGISKSLNF